MAEQKLLVKREGDFHYPIYLKNDFQDLAGAIREEGLENRNKKTPTPCYRRRSRIIYCFRLQSLYFHSNLL